MLRRVYIAFAMTLWAFHLISQTNAEVTSIVVEDNNVSGGGFQSDVTITENGRTVYSSADVSGIFKSIDGGLTYHNVNQGLKSPKVASLAITPDNESILYAGTGDKGGSGGLFRSINSGNTWALTKDGDKAQFAGNHSAKTDPIPDNHPRSNGDLIVVVSGLNQSSYTDDIVIAGTYKKGVRIFTQGGEVEASAVDTSGFVRSVAYDPSIPTKAYAAIQFQKSELSGIYEIDFENPFAPESNLVYPTPLPEGVTVLSSGHVYAAIGDGGIVKYNGNNWFLVNTGLDTGNNLRQWTAVTGYVAGNTDIIYAGVNNLGGSQVGSNYSSVWRSNNGGTSWEPLVNANQNVEDKIYGQTYNWWYRVKGFPQAGLGRTNNVVSSIDVAQGNSDLVSDDIIYVSGRGGIWKSERGGESWVPAVYNMQATANNDVAVNPLKPEQVVIANTDYVLLETGNTFENSDVARDKPNGSESRGYDVIFDKVSRELILSTGDRDFNEGGEVFVKSAGAIGLPSDSGWKNTGLNAIVDKRVLAVTYGYPGGANPENQTILAAVEGAGVYRYHNDAWSFTGLSIGATERSNMIWPDNTNSSVVFLLDLLGGLYRSNDGGLSWTNIWPTMRFNNNDFFNVGYLTADDDDPTTIYVSVQGRKGSPINTNFKVYRLTDADTMMYGAPGTAGITDISKHSGNKTIKRPGPLVLGPNGNLWLTEQQNSVNDVSAALYVMENPRTDLSFRDVTTNEYRNLAIQPSGIDASSDNHVYIAQNGTGLVKISYAQEQEMSQTTDVGLENEVSETSPNVGDVVTFTITVSNNGPVDATNVDVEDIIPNGYTNANNISMGGVLLGNKITWSGLGIAPGGRKILTFDVEVLSPGVGVDYKNTAEVIAMDQADNDSEPNNDDGDQSEDDEDFAIVSPQVVDIFLDIEVDNPSPDMGSTVTFTIRVGNDGPSPATNIDVINVIPNGYTNITSVSSGGLIVGSTLTWSIASLPSGANQVLTYNAKVTVPGAGIDFLNVVQVSDIDQFDSDSTPNNDDGDQNEDDEDSTGVSPVIIMSIGSTVFLDINNNGLQDVTDPGISGVGVELCDVNGNILHGTTTDNNGVYLFEGLAPGEYIVKIPNPHPVYNTSSSYDGLDDGIDGDDNGIQLVTGGSTTSQIITLVGGTESTIESAQGGLQDDAADAYGDMTIDFGFYEPASIGNFVWFDIDGNGAQDFDEPGLDGVTINLLDSNSNIIATTTSSASFGGNTNYLFQDLAPGDYQVQFVTPNAYTSVLHNTNGITGETSECSCPNEDALDNDADTITGLTHMISLESGEVEDEVDAGFNLLLDVELLSFTARYVENKNVVKLEWVTSNEVDNDYFEVQRAQENESFVSIARKDGIGYSTAESLYDFEDEDIQSIGTFFYRLKQVSEAGSVSYSDVISINVGAINTAKKAILVYPNPANDYVNIDITKGENDIMSYQIYNLVGKMTPVNSSQIIVEDKHASIVIPTQELPNGTLILRIQIGQEIFTKKITIVK